LPREELAAEVGELLWRKYGKQVGVDWPSPKTDDKWRLTSLGWVGYIPLTEEVAFYLKPKVELTNLFRMCEYAYDLKMVFLDGDFECSSLKEFYERLANILARRVLARNRKGLYRAYVPEVEQLPFVRGRLDTRSTIRLTWDVNALCHYEEHTADVEENQILAWTLWRIAHSGLCTDRVLPVVRKAYRALQGFARLAPFGPDACVKRFYNRLNDDYHPLHALCRFFLDHSGPSHGVGGRTMLPFLIYMPVLYERFVAAWLRENLPPEFVLRVHENVHIGSSGAITFDIDLVLEDAESGDVLTVLDTKYKSPERPSTDDVQQVVAYATAKGCNEAILVYPLDLPEPLDERVGSIRVKSLPFELSGDLDEAGRGLLRSLSRKHFNVPSAPR